MRGDIGKPMTDSCKAIIFQLKINFKKCKAKKSKTKKNSFQIALEKTLSLSSLSIFDSGKVSLKAV